MEERFLVLALRGRDGSVAANILSKQGYDAVVCPNLANLVVELEKGAAAALVTEESLGDAPIGALATWLRSQPPWSDFPFILIATKRTGRRGKEAKATLELLGNVVVLERPIHVETLTSAASSALRVRRRQYEARSRLRALHEAEAHLKHLNANLEERIAQRTSELSDANNRLMQEIANRERAQAALVQAQKMEAVGQLTGGIAHDFNNLLTVVTGNLDLVARRTSDARTKRQIGLAADAADRAAKLTQQLLAFSRTQQLAISPIDLNSLVEGMSDLLERTIGPQIIQHLVLDPTSPWVLGDSHQVELAILNLAINARDAMPHGGTLTIETSSNETPPPGLPAGAFCVIRVRDSGTGIPARMISKVFDPFFTTKPLGKGTGLGLSQVFGISRQSGGTAQIESSSKRGTTVAIWLPLVDPPEVKQSDVDGVAVCEPAMAGRLMVVDDDEGVRRFIEESLEMLGYNVVGAASGEQALGLLGNYMPDVLIVDFAMPGMSGAELAQRAKSLVSDLPVILVTGYAEMEKALETQFAAVLRKPFKLEALSTAVRGALNTRLSLAAEPE